MSPSKPEVHLLATGGTIANPLDIEGYLPGQQLVDEVPEVGEVADVSVTDVASTGSSGMTPKIWWDLHSHITELAKQDAPPDGIVITHGSNTVEETAYFLHLSIDTEIPIVLTAAQRNHRLVGNDGDRNLVDAVKIASHPEARGRGALVVLNDEIHTARDVTKTVSGRPDAWHSANLGVIGLIDKRDNIGFYRTTERLHGPDTEFDISGRTANEFPEIEIVYSFAGADGKVARAAVEAGAEGLVVASLPTGSPAAPTDEDRASQNGVLHGLLDEGLPVVLTHRGLDGWPYPTHGYIWGDTLTPQKARILLGLGLMHTDDQDELQEFFRKY